MPASGSSVDFAREWLRLDQNPVTRQEVEQLLLENDIEELDKRMLSRIEFGTAGLRGRMEAGWSRMNDLIVIQASQGGGLCSYVLCTIINAATRGIVIGYDHRHNSERWALLAAVAFQAMGCKVFLLSGLVHTPLVPYSVKKLSAACGVMITASHNPKQDNGYKVYWENAVQIISPHDVGISKAIQENLEPRTWDTSEIFNSPLFSDPTKDMIASYFSNLSQLCHSRSLNATSPLKFVNTSMHGVSHKFMVQAFQTFGFQPFIPVAEQASPDPEFPTVKFPNPEEKGALDLAIAEAQCQGADYVLAQDPDSDRFSAVERGPSGAWISFTGDQLGVLFASKILEDFKMSGKSLDKLAIVASTVSSKMVEAMAETEGFRFAECLTGFKFIGNTALNLTGQGYEVPFGYEEAIGYMFGDQIRDKDGVAASMVFAELVTSLHISGKTASSRLQELYRKFGYFETRNGYFICNEPSTIDRIFERIRSYNGKSARDIASYPTTIAGLNVSSVIDLTTGFDSTNFPSFKPALPLSSGHMIQFRAESLDHQYKITLTTRTSGTEPKIKYYLEGSGEDPQVVRVLLPKVVDELGEDWMEANRNNLGKSS